MDASFLEDILDPEKCSKLGMEEKRELVYKVSKMSNFSPEMLQSWTRQDILEILCAEMGKERKYTGLTKLKIIENLLRIVAEKKKSPKNGVSSNSSPDKDQRSFKRQRKSDHPNHFLDATTDDAPVTNATNSNITYCKNLACRARLTSEYSFCKRCSCCICRAYDDNKDPSLWLVCNSEPPFQGESCGMSCHLECAIRHERSGIVVKDRTDGGINGSFYCVACGKTNDILSSLRKQLVTARDTRRVDILCYRISLSQKILGEAKSCNGLCSIMDEAVGKLEEEVGPLTGSPVKTARGIVNRLSSGPEVQSLCGLAVDYLDSMLSERVPKVEADPILQGYPLETNKKVLANSILAAPELIRFEDVSASSATVVLASEESTSGNVVGYTLWHRKRSDPEYPADPTCTLFAPNTTFVIPGLNPNTEYLLKVVSLDSKKELGVREIGFQTGEEEEEEDGNGLSNRNEEVEEEEARISPGPEISPSCYTTDNGSNSQPETNSGLPITPYKTESRFQPNNEEEEEVEEEAGPPGTTSKKRIVGGGDKEEDDGGDDVMGGGEKGFEYYVKVIRWLECSGRIGTGFREKFLTWYSLRASPQEVRVVKAFVDTLIDDPDSLAGQLVHSFSDLISNTPSSSSVVPSGFCLRLWH
ncbi:unnamed protein product [Cuscuta campestris]|uniref:Fibronectin type-III domain-containing protein n=1 Tax=Cuscuta campestris TaxID=132261 RepID=A0A484L1N6_9ASTE|nr:unnamed protein product [Cuscuta campestris]